MEAEFSVSNVGRIISDKIYPVFIEKEPIWKFVRIIYVHAFRWGQLSRYGLGSL